MTDMFRGAEAFNQDLGWCLGDHVKLAEKETFKKTKCESTRCGVAQKDEFGTCDPGTRAGYITLIVLLLLLAGAGAYVRQRKKEDETYVAAARRLLCCLCYRNETDSNSVTSSQPASPAESPPDQPEKVGLPGRGWVYTESGTQKTCKHCGQARSQSMFVEKQWKKPRPTCVDCAAKLSAQNEPTRTKQPPPPGGGVSVRQQLEYYFSPRNWGQDAFLKSLADEDGAVALEAFFTFPRIAALLPTTVDAATKTPDDDRRVLAAAVRKSSQLDLTPDGLRVKARRKRARDEKPPKPPAIAGLELSEEELARRAKRAAKFAADAARPPPLPPKRTFAHPGGRITSNKEEATEKFLRRKQKQSSP